MQIINPWSSNKLNVSYFAISENELVYKLGDYSVYRQNISCWLYTYKNKAINQLAGLNKDHVRALFEDKRPTNEQQAFLFDRAKHNYNRQLI